MSLVLRFDWGVRVLASNNFICMKCTGSDVVYEYIISTDSFVALCRSCHNKEELKYGRDWQTFKATHSGPLARTTPSRYTFPTIPPAFTSPLTHPLAGKSASIRVGEIEAFRVWRIHKSCSLYSMVVGRIWKPGEIVTGDPTKYVASSILGGVHAWKLLPTALDYAEAFLLHEWQVHAHLMADENPFAGVAIGRVALWGTVDEHMNGYRAENARILDIAACYPMHCGFHQTNQIEAPVLMSKVTSKYKLKRSNPMPELCAIVGMHFRPPAKAIMACLPTGAELRLEREPGNEYDPHAIKVFVQSSAIPASQHSDLDLQASGFGSSLEAILDQQEWHVGYIASKPPKGRGGLILAPALAPRLDAGEKFKATLQFDGAGAPIAELGSP